jgi:DNA-binding CsgD family transcriptional regulator
LFEQYNDVLLNLYQAPHQKNGWQDFTEKLAAFTNSRSGVVTVQNKQSMEIVALGHTGFDESDLLNWQNYYLPIDPWVEALEASPKNVFYSGDKLVDRRIFNKSECANDFTFRLGIHAAAGISIEQETNNYKVVIALQQDKARGELEKDTFHYLNQMSAHIEQAALLTSHTLPLLNSNKAFLEHIAQPSFICDPMAQVELLNSAAEALARGLSPVTISNKKLTLQKKRLDQKLARMILDASSLTDIHAGSFLRLQNIHYNLIIKVTPWLEVGQDPLASRKVLVMIKDVQDVYPLNRAELEAFFGLTQREAQIAQSLALGQTAKDLAQTHNVKESTIRSHIKSIFVKTGCKNQVHLTAVLNSSRLHSK